MNIHDPVPTEPIDDIPGKQKTEAEQETETEQSNDVKQYTEVEQGIEEKPARPVKQVAIGLVLLMVIGVGTFMVQKSGKNSTVESPPNFPHPLMVKSLKFIEQGDFSKAIVPAKELFALQPDQPEALILVARVLLYQERLHDAVEYADRALKINPNLAEPHAVIGKAYLPTSEFDQALENSRKALILDSTLSLPYEVIGEVYLRQGNFNDSIAVFSEALKFKTGDPEIMHKLGGAYIKGKDLENAFAILLEALEKFPQVAGIHFNLARAYSESNGGAKSIKHIGIAERLYSEQKNTIWSAKSRQAKTIIAKKFKMTPEDMGF